MSKKMTLGASSFAPIKGIVFCACGKNAGVLTSDGVASVEKCITCAGKWIAEAEARYPNEKWAEVDS